MALTALKAADAPFVYQGMGGPGAAAAGSPHILDTLLISARLDAKGLANATQMDDVLTQAARLTEDLLQIRALYSQKMKPEQLDAKRVVAVNFALKALQPLKLDYKPTQGQALFDYFSDPKHADDLKYIRGIASSDFPFSP